MIQFKTWRQYTQVTDGIRIPENPKEPTVIFYFSENSSFLEDYQKLNLMKMDFRIVVVPYTLIPRTMLTSELRVEYKKYGLLAYSTKQPIPKGRNIIFDFSHYIQAIDQRFKPTTYRQRAGFMLKNLVDNFMKTFPENYRTIFCYSIDQTKPFNDYINRKLFLYLKDLKDGNVPFDNMMISYINNESAMYRLLIKDKDYKFDRALFYLRYIKTVTSSDEVTDEMEEEIINATNTVVKKVGSDLSKEHLPKVYTAVRKYLKANNDEVIKVNSDDVTDDDITTIATTSILYRVSGEMNKAKSIARIIPSDKKKIALKAIDKNFSKEILSSKQTVSLSTDVRVQVFNPTKMVDNISPEHLYEKRQQDFKMNLKNDLENSFRVLETTSPKLFLQNTEFVDHKQRTGELMKSDLIDAKITLKDEFGNIHNIEIQLPKINPDTGTFRLNGNTKCLVNQIVQCPITFPAPGESRFESSYSIFRIYSKKLRNEQYLEGFMSYKIPLIYLLAFSFGFDETIKLYKLTYEVLDTPLKEKYGKRVGSKYIRFGNVTTELQKQLVQSFIHEKDEILNSIDSPFPSPEFFEKYIIKITGRINSTFLIGNNIKNIVDPVVKQVLKNQQLPTELNYIMKYMSEKVVDGYVIDRSDLSNQRIRNSEVLVHLAQKQILATYTNYKEQVLSGNTEAKFNLNSTKVLTDFIMTELVTDMEYANPIEEMSTMTRISPVGKKVGGIPDKMAIPAEARTLHPSYFGNVDPLDTPEGGNIGMVQQLTINSLISSSRGLFGNKEITDKEYSGMLSTTTSMVPFLENTDGARVIMLSNQAKQMVPLKNPEPPAIQSGYESILTNVLSSNFVKKSPCNGTIIKITRDEIIMKCGTKTETIDLSPIHLRSGSGKNTLSVFRPTVTVGQTVKEGMIIAEGACMSNGSISLGRPLLTALMPYKGFNFEDGVIISDKLVREDKLTSLHGIVEDVLISENDRILQIVNIGEYVKKGNPLIRKTIGEVEELIGFDEDETTDIMSGQYIKKSPGGVVVDIEVFSNTKEDKFPMLKELIDRTNKKHGKITKENFTIKGEVIKGVMIKFKVEQELKINLGDKLCNRYGNKGIISLIEKEEDMPRLPNGERIEIILNPIGLIARMNMGQLYEMYCGFIAKQLGSIFLSSDRKKSIEILRKVYSELDMSPNKKFTSALIGNMEALPNTHYDRMIQDIRKTGFYSIIIPPFKAPGYKEIKRALKIVNLETSYNLFIPEYGVKTTNPVPVGYMYISKLEHLGDNKIYGRSTGAVTGKTGQPTSGKRRGGGQRVGELDTYCFISYDCPNTLAEFMGPLSDDQATKEEMLAEIVQTGKTEYKEAKYSPARDLLNSYFISLMLERG